MRSIALARDTGPVNRSRDGASSAPREHQVGYVGPAIQQHRVRLGKPVQILARFERSEKQDRSRPGRCGSSRPSGVARTANGDLLSFHTEAFADLAPGVFGVDDHALGAAGMGCSQRGVVAADFRLRVFRAIEEVQVVDRDEPDAAAGNQHRVHRVHDVGRTGKPLNRRPLEPVPREVEELDGKPQIGLRCARHRRRRQSILPRAGEQPERVVWGQAPGQCHGKAMDVFADPGGLAKRGTVVHQDTHAGRIVAHQK